VSAERDDFRGEPADLHADEHEGYAPRSIFAAGWFRALLVLTILAILVVVALPYLLNWLEPVSWPVKGPARMTQGPEPAGAPASVPAPSPAQSAPPAPAAPALQKSAAPAAPALPPGPARAGAPASAKPSPPLPMAKAGGIARSPERAAAVSTRPSSALPETERSYWVQLGLFKDLKNAERLATKLRDQGFSVQVASVARSERAAAGDVSGGAYHLVRAGAFPDRQRAVAARDDLESRGYSGFLTQGTAK
jgi:cell division septation protein DedD